MMTVFPIKGWKIKWEYTEYSVINDLQNKLSFRNKGDKPRSTSDHCLGPGL